MPKLRFIEDGKSDGEGEGEDGDKVGVGDEEGETYGKGELKEGGTGDTGNAFSFGFSTWSDLASSVETVELMRFLCHVVVG